MGRSKGIGSTISMNHEINMKGPGVRTRGTKENSWPDLAAPTPDISSSFAAMLPTLKSVIPISAGKSGAGSQLEMAALGSICASAGIALNPAPGGSGYLAVYKNVIQLLTNGAYTKSGIKDEEKIKKMIMALISSMLENSGPAFSSYTEVLKDLMQNATLQDFMKGVQSAVCAMTGDPVNANTGNFIYEKEDLLMKGRYPLYFKRSYNSMDTRAGCMGKGWRHNYEIQLLIESDRYIILWEDGREELYLRKEDNMLEPLFGCYCRLRMHDGGFLYETQDKQVYAFDSRGLLLHKKDLNGQGLQFLYDNQNRLSSVSNGYGSTIHYKYDSFSGMLIRVCDHTGRSVELTYELGRLKEVKNAMGATYRYAYDVDKNVYEIRNPGGILVLKNSYDGQGRTVGQTFADGGTIGYDYQEESSRTLVTEQNGSQVAYVHDEKFRNIKTIYADGEEKFLYNDRNLLTSKTDKNGNRTKYSYDDRGNTSQIIYPDGEKHNMTYDAGNRLISWSVNGAEKLKNTYDTRGNLIKTSDALFRCREMEYDEKGNAVRIKQPDGSQLLLKYDSRGNIIHITDAAGSCTVYEYDDCNRAVRTIDGNGGRTSFSYDAGNQITGVTNSVGSRRTYEYTQNGKLAKITDFNGAVTMQEYNNMNQVKSICQPDGGITRMEYDLMQNITRKVLPNGAEITYAYDGLNRMEQMQLPTGGVVRYEYDPNGNRTAVIDAGGNRTTMEYDERDRLTKTTDPAGASTEYEYNSEGRLTCVTNAAGKPRTYTYDKEGQVISETDVAGNKTCYEYDEIGNITVITDPKKRKTVYEYAPGGTLLKTIYPDGAYELYTHDKNGNLTRRRNQKGDILDLTYDCLNRLTNVKSSFGQEMDYTYNAVGKVTSIKDALGHVTYYEYSPEGRVTSVIDAAGNRTEYAYDTMGGLATICQHIGNDMLLKGEGQKQQIPGPGDGNQVHYIHYKRNLYGKVETITDPLGLQEHYSYDLTGRAILKKDKEGYETHYAYNPAGDMESITYADGRSVAFTYNPLRQLTEIRDWLGTTRIEPDDMGRAKKVTDHMGREVSYQWSRTGEKEALVYPDGRMVSYEYDDLSRLTRLVDGAQEIRYHYDEEGRLSEKSFPNGITSSYQYNSMGLLSSLSHQKDGEILEEYEHEYDRMCNKIGIHKKRRIGLPDTATSRETERKLQEENGYYQYKYDSLNRLTEVKKDRESLHSYEYDVFGNRTRKSTEKGNVRYYYNAANQLIRSEGVQPEETYQYDARGNMTAVIRGRSTVNRYVYDETNRLAAAINLKGEAAGYEYDGLGNRVAVQEYAVDMPSYGNYSITELIQTESPAKEVDYLLDLTKPYHNLLARTETMENRTSIQDYTWDSNAVFMTEGDSAHIYLQDELGSTIRLEGVQENRQTIYGYDEFGQDLYGNQGEAQPFGYTGYRRDTIANTYFAQAREYLPGLGRFGGEDVNKGYINMPCSFNLFSYVYSSPLSFVDLEGETATQVLKTGMSIAAGVALSDSPAPGPMDIVALLIGAGTLIASGCVAVYDWTTEKTEEKEKIAAIANTDTKESKPQIIYRSGSGNGTNLTPREGDIGGLSYYLKPPAPPYTITTVEAVESTGLLVADVDGINHASVKPVNPLELSAWIKSRPTAKENPHYLTKLLASVSIKNNGRPCNVNVD